MIPHLPDIHWNYTAAAAASMALRRAAALLRITADERSRAAAQATAEWHGGERDKFDPRLRQLLAEAERLAHHFATTAALIDRASERAREEQRRREHEREEQRRLSQTQVT